MGMPIRDDLIIRKVRITNATAYSVRIHDVGVPFIAPTNDAARRLADDFARAFQRDVWYTEDDDTFTCLSGFRFVGRSY
jgi:hypothetical protein